MKNIHIIDCGNTSLRFIEEIKKIFISFGFFIYDRYKRDVDLVVTIGGDGTFLSSVRDLGYPDCFFVGINTGHLGFFQEVEIHQVEKFARSLKDGDFHVYEMNPVAVNILGEEFYAINEISIKSDTGKTIHMDVYVGDDYIEGFSGDGIIVSTTAGSTGYNYSSGGSLVDPHIKLLQITPISPLNSNAYRCITSGIILPSNAKIGIKIDDDNIKKAGIYTDAIRIKDKLDGKLSMYYSEDISIKLIRYGDYKFWTKVKDKFL